MAPQHAARNTKPPSGGFLAGRGVLLVLLAVAIGVLLLARAVGPDDDAVAAGGSGTATTVAGSEDGGTDTPTTQPPADEPTVTTMAPAGDPASVVVLVANARGVAGAAGANTEALKVENYNVLAATDYPNIEPATQVFFQAGHQADAVAVADALGITQASVAPIPDTGLAVDKGQAVVVVVLGQDGQGVSPG